MVALPCGSGSIIQSGMLAIPTESSLRTKNDDHSIVTAIFLQAPLVAFEHLCKLALRALVNKLAVAAT